MKIYIVRHGQTKCNVENKYNCRLDEDINEMGIEQAKQAREKVKKINIDLIICSPMKRTKHTKSNYAKHQKNACQQRKICCKSTARPVVAVHIVAGI